MADEGVRRFKVTLPDADYFRNSVKCQAACPVGTDAGGYVRAIAEGDFELAYLIARAPNPLASICGRVCGAPCEAACRRRDIDQAVSIRALKRFATSQFGVESNRYDPRELIQRVIGSAARRLRRGREDISAVAQALAGGEGPSGPRIAIVGGGPAGLSAAHDLALLGYRPTIFELEPVPAGMLALGIPEYRLPRQLIQAEVDVIRALGVEIRCNVAVGKDVTLAELRSDYAATLIAIGAKKAQSLPIPGSEGRGVLGGVDMLRSIALGEPVELGRRVVVVGGGRVAFDVSRTVVRQSGLDVSRSAARAAGVREVHLCSLESLQDMPAEDVDIIEGRREGIRLHPSLGPKEIHLDENGRVRAVSFKTTLSVFDEHGRFAPRFDEEKLTTIEADTVLWSIGQQSDFSFIEPERDGIRLDERGQVAVDPESLQTSAPDVFAIGDCAHGVDLMIQAIASGKRGARSVHHFLGGDELRVETTVQHTEVEGYVREKDFEKLPRGPLPTRPIAERAASQALEVEQPMTRQTAVREASRCLDCGVNTIFDSSRCILCGGCVEVCPEDCLRIVSLDRIEADEAVREVLDRLCEGRAPSDVSTILKDESHCIRCAECAKRCPTGAISMERLSLQEIYS